MKKKIILIAVICISASRKIGISLHSTFLFFLICTFTHLHISTFAQVANGTGAGNCLSFNGTSDGISTNMVTPIGAQTMAFWFKRTNTNVVVVLENTNGTWSNDGIAVNLYGGQVRYSSSKGGGQQRFDVYSNSTNYNDGKWHYVACVWDGTTNANGVKIFVDGVLDNQGTSNAVQTSSSGIPLSIGSSGGYYFSGQLDEVRIWNRALTQTEIRDGMCKKLKGDENGLMGYWRFDEGSGSTTFDASPNGNNGTLH